MSALSDTGYRLEATGSGLADGGDGFTWCDERDCFRAPHPAWQPHVTYREEMPCPNCGSILDTHTDLCPTPGLTYERGEGRAVLMAFFEPYPRTLPFGTAYPRKMGGAPATAIESRTGRLRGTFRG